MANIIDDTAEIAAAIRRQKQPQQKGDEDPKKGVDLELINGKDRTPVEIDWTWNGYLARGKLQLLAGAKGAGKTTIAVSLAAAFTVGGNLPDGTRAPLGDVVMWSGEDGIEDTLIPRFLAANGLRERMHFVRRTNENGKPRPFDAATDMFKLARSAV